MKQVLFLLSIIFLFMPQGTRSQTLNDRNIPAGFSEAMNAYTQGNYSLAYELFSGFYNAKGVDRELSSTARYYGAESLLRMDREDAAISEFEYFTSNFPLSAYRDEALYKLGTLYYGKKEYENSRRKLILLIDDYPGSQYAGSAFYFVGDSYARENKTDEAIKFFTDAISTKKNNKYIDNSIYSLAGIYEKTGNYKMAVAYYDSLLAYYNNSTLAPHAQVRIGLCYFELKEYDNAVIELNDPLITQLPARQQTEAKYVLGNAYYRLKEFNQAGDTFHQILKDNPQTPLQRNIKYALGWVYFQQQKYDEAFNAFSSIQRRMDDTVSASAMFWSAEAKRYAGLDREADKLYNEFLTVWPNSNLVPKVKYLLGIVNYTDNKTAQSEEYLLASAASSDLYVKGNALTVLGEVMLNKKDYLKARDYFQKALDVETLSKELSNRATLGTAVADYYLNRYDETIKILTELNAASPSFEADKVHFYMGECFFAKKDYAKALKQYNQVTAENKELYPQMIYGKAYANFNLKNFNESSYLFEEFVKNNPNSANYKDARLRLADSYYGQKKFSQAGRLYRQVFLSDSSQINNDYAYYQYAQAVYKAGNPAEAIREFDNLQQKFPDSKYVAESQYVIGWINFQRGNFRDAIASYHKLISLYPSSPVVPVALNSIGNAYFNLGRYDSSIVYYNKVLTEYPGSSNVFDAITGIKDAYVVSERPEMAVSVIDDFIAKNHGSSVADEVMFKKGELFYSQRDYPKAQAAYKEFIAAYPNSQLVPEAYYWVGKCAANLGQNEEALFNFNRVFTGYLNSEVGISAVIEMGKIHTDLKNYDQAINIYSVAIDKLPPESPKVAEIMYNRAMLNVTKGDMTKAYEDFNYLIQYYSTSLFAANAKYEVALLELARKNYEQSDLLFKELAE
ncbi:MAG: tetratricopeptide repeat protein, partial [Syntrophothermus sp.]